MQQQQPPHLTPSALFEDQAKLDAMRLQVYNRLLTSVHQKIKFVSQQPHGDQMTHYDFPEWQPGCPRFDVKDCILYCAWNLRHAGFKVIYMSPNRLLISWKEQSIQYYQEESPIRQAMIAAASQSHGSQKSVTGVTAASQARTEKKKAATYKPASEGVAGLLATGKSSRGGTGTITFI